MNELANVYGPRFKKEILSRGPFTDPRTGARYDFSVEELRLLADATNRWCELGYKVPFPASVDADPADPLGNLGYWSEFTVEGEKLVALVEILDERALPGIGKAFDAVAPRITREAQAATGEWVGDIVESIAASASPPVPRLGGFVALGRGAPRTSPL